MSYKDDHIQVLDKLEMVVDGFLEEIGAEFEAQTKRNTAVDTSQTKESWTHVVDTDEKKAIVGSPLQNAIWEEFGTGNYAVNGDGRSEPWYIPVDGFIGTKHPTYQGKVVIVYGKQGKRFFKCDGKRPRRPLQTAKDTIQPKIQKILDDKLKELQ